MRPSVSRGKEPDRLHARVESGVQLFPIPSLYPRDSLFRARGVHKISDNSNDVRFNEERDFVDCLGAVSLGHPQFRSYSINDVCIKVNGGNAQ